MLSRRVILTMNKMSIGLRSVIYLNILPKSYIMLQVWGQMDTTLFLHLALTDVRLSRKEI